jgi:hypothetical protein
MSAASIFGLALGEMGRYTAARQIQEDTLARRRRLFGDDHRQTLRSASNLAAALRELGGSRPPVSWMKTSLRGAAASSATTTPTP